MGWKKSFDELFQSDASLWLKIVGGAAVGGICAIVAIVRQDAEVPDKEQGLFIQGVIFVGAVVVGGLLGATLSLKDLVERRHREGRPTPFLLRLFFGMGVVSLLLVWVPLVFLVTIATVILTLGT